MKQQYVVFYTTCYSAELGAGGHAVFTAKDDECAGFTAPRYVPLGFYATAVVRGTPYGPVVWSTRQVREQVQEANRQQLQSILGQNDA